MGKFSVFCLSADADAMFICYGTQAGRIGFCDLVGNRIRGLKEFKAFQCTIGDLKLNKSGDKVLAIGYDKDPDEIFFHGKIKLFRRDGTLLAEFKYDGQPETCLFSFDERSVYAGCFGGEVVTFTIDGNVTNVFQAIDYNAVSRCIVGFDRSPDGKLLVTTGLKKAEIWSIDGSRIKVLQISEFTPINAVFSPDGRLIAVDEFVKVVTIYKTTGELVTRIPAYDSGGISDIVFSADSNYILVCNQMQGTKLFRIDGKHCSDYDTAPDTIRGIFVPNSDTMLTLSFKCIQKIDRKTGTVTTIRVIK